LSDERERELVRRAEHDPQAALALFRAHRRLPQPEGDGWPTCCSSCRRLIEKAREWFSKWATYLVDPQYAFVFDHPELFEQDASPGRRWGIPALEEFRALAREADAMLDVMNHVLERAKAP